MNTTDPPLIKLKNVSKLFPYGKKKLCALHDISLEISRGTTLGVVGESGCGKSTLGRVILKLEEASFGQVYFEDKPITSLSKRQMQPFRQHMQMIFQDPSSSLDPRFTVQELIGEGIDIHKIAMGKAKEELIAKLLADVRLEPDVLKRYPHEFSGGQKQRIGIARGLAVNPRFIVCDEPLSALDVCTQKQILELLLRLQKEWHLTYFFISHDLDAIKAAANRVAVMYLGHIVELAPTKELFHSPKHPYTEALIEAIPSANPAIAKSQKRLKIYGDPPSPLNPPKGCPFHPRCPKAMSICKELKPKLQESTPQHFVACHALEE